MGIYVYIKHDKKTGLITSFFSILWLILSVKIIIPYFSEGLIWYSDKFLLLGKSLNEVLVNIITKPILVIKVLTLCYWVKLKYLFYIFAPMGFLPFLYPSTLILTVPQLLENLLSASTAQWSIMTQYVTVVIPFAFISLIYGIRNLELFCCNKKNLFKIFIYFSIICFIAMFYVINPLKTINFKTTPNIILGHNFIKMIPPEASVSASSFYLGQLSSRERIILFPNPFINCFMIVPDHKLTDYILLDLTRIDQMAIGNMSKKDIGVITDITYSMGKLWAIPFKSRMYDVVAAENGIFLFKVKPEFKDKTVKYDYRYPNKFEIIK